MEVSIILSVSKLSSTGRRNLEFNLRRMLSSKFTDIIVIQQIYPDSPPIKPDSSILHISINHSQQITRGQMINIASRFARGKFLMIHDYNMYVDYTKIISSLEPKDIIVKPGRFFYNFDENSTSSLITSRKVKVVNQERAFYENIEGGSFVINKDLFAHWGGMNEEVEGMQLADTVSHMVGGRIKYLDSLRGGMLYSDDEKANAHIILRSKVIQPAWSVKMDESHSHKINYAQQWKTNLHRSGWGYAIESLRWLHHPNGALLDGFVEKKFAWEANSSAFKHHKAYSKPWVGFIHVPQNIPNWFQYYQSPQHIFKSTLWKKSLPYCQGIFCLSKYHRDWLYENIDADIPVSTLIHPTEIPDLKFTMDRFLSNPNKQVVQVGWWLRKLNSIYQLPVKSYERVFLYNFMPWVNELMMEERRKNHLTIDDSSARIQSFLSNREYDESLSSNIIFMHMYDCSASNAIIECIARDTPLLINPLPAVVEYLGEDYPFYFNTLEEAAEKAENLDLVNQAHLHMVNNPIKKKFTQEYFCESFVNSEVYKTLSIPKDNDIF